MPGECAAFTGIIKAFNKPALQTGAGSAFSPSEEHLALHLVLRIFQVE